MGFLRKNVLTPPLALLGLLVCAYALWMMLPAARSWQGIGSVLQPLIGLLVTYITWQTALRQAAPARRGWVLFALSLSAWTMGDIAFNAYTWRLGEAPFPSWIDGVYLLYPPLLLLGMLELVRRQKAGGYLRLSLDIGTVVVTAGTYFWHFLLAAIARPYAGEPLALAVTLAYPFTDLLLLSVLLLLLFRDTAWLPLGTAVWLGLGLVFNLVADPWYTALEASGAYGPAHPVDLLYVLAQVAFALSAAGALTPARTLPLPGWFPQLSLYVPYLAVAASFILLALTLGQGTAEARVALASAGLVTALVIARQVLAFRENDRLTRALRATSSELEQRASQLSYLAQHDPLTGLPNRALFETRLAEAIQAADRAGELVGVLFLDLDHFKAVNDTLGHEVGDALLVAVAERLRGTVRATDTVARLGGDEFTVVLARLPEPRVAERVVTKLLNVLSEPFAVAGRSLFVTGSIGVALYPRDGTDVSTLQRHADAAMYQAKFNGRNGFRVFRPEYTAQALERLEFEQDLRMALRRGELEVYYQPQVALGGGEVLGLEALVRWRHPRYGLLPPGRFIPLAEETGLIVPIGNWVLREACRRAVEWGVRVAVNVSAIQFCRADFAGVVAEVLEESGLEPLRLELELTESTVMRDAEESARQLERLRTMGVRISIDDFGTGHSSLGLLRSLLINALKIDRSFVAGLPGSRSDTTLVKAVLAIADALGLDVVVEGIETEAQQQTLRKLGCRIGQGYAFARPLPAGEIPGLLSTGARAKPEVR
ncbi:MAG TPA: EAL domain-containing protein [Meiothermus sp.]|nr:EAL domain-containing protein [Meiothermus sp.]